MPLMRRISERKSRSSFSQRFMAVKILRIARTEREERTLLVDEHSRDTKREESDTQVDRSFEEECLCTSACDVGTSRSSECCGETSCTLLERDTKAEGDRDSDMDNGEHAESIT